MATEVRCHGDKHTMNIYKPRKPLCTDILKDKSERRTNDTSSCGFLVTKLLIKNVEFEYYENTYFNIHQTSTLTHSTRIPRGF